MIAVLDYGIGNLRSAEKALQHVGGDAVLVDDPDVAATARAIVLPGVGAFGRCAAALRDSGLDRVALDAVASGRPFLGICVGFQLLYEGSEEDPAATGLGVLDGVVRRLPPGVKHPQMQWNVLEPPPGPGGAAPSGPPGSPGAPGPPSAPSAPGAPWTGTTGSSGSMVSSGSIASTRPTAHPGPTPPATSVPPAGRVGLLDGIPAPAWVYFVHSFAPELTDATSSVCRYGGPVTASAERGAVWGTQFHPEKSGAVGLGILANFVRTVAAADGSEVAAAAATAAAAAAAAAAAGSTTTATTATTATTDPSDPTRR